MVRLEASCRAERMGMRLTWREGRRHLHLHHATAHRMCLLGIAIVGEILAALRSASEWVALLLVIRRAVKARWRSGK